MELEGKIKPALNIAHGKGLTTEEFQYSLFEYFEEKGIISNLRAHLRSHMVNVLKETCLGKALLSKKPEASPKLQAQNLLIAEYLLQRNYHYTLSVLSAEVPLNNAFPPINYDDCVSKSRSFKFTKSDMSDILEALGLNRQPDVAEKLSYRYRLSGKESLLACILQSVPELVEQTNANNQDTINSFLNKHDFSCLNLETMINLLKSTGVNIDVILKLCELIKEAIVNEVSSLKRMKDEQLSKMKKKMSHDMSCKTRKYKEKIAELESNYSREKERLESELRQTKDNLILATSQVQAKYNDIIDLNEHIKSLEMRLQQQELTLLGKEYSLQQRQEYLENKQRVVDKQFEEMKLISRAQQASQHVPETREKHTEIEVELANKGTTTKIVTSASACVETGADARQAQLMRENAKAKDEMQEEITKLKDQNISYQSKIQELLLRTNSLLAQLETRTTQARRPSFSARTRRPPDFHGGAGGEEVSDEPPCRESAHPTTAASSRHNKCYFRNSSSEDDTHTDEILQQAKQRLLELECESAAIDTHFDALPKNTLRTDTSAACLIQTFQSNVCLLKDSLTKLFYRGAPASPASKPQSADLEFFDAQSIKTAESVHQKNQDETKPQATAERKEDQKKAGSEAENYHSTSSSGMVVDSSMSTIELSEDADQNCEWVDIGEL